MEPLDEEIVLWNHKKEFALLLVGGPTYRNASSIY